MLLLVITVVISLLVIKELGADLVYMLDVCREVNNSRRASGVVQHFVTLVCVSLTQCGVVKGEFSQVSGVLRQGEQPPGVAVPHQGAPGAVLQHAVLDDLHTEAGRNTR